MANQRRYQRYRVAVPINVQGTDIQGNIIEEETFTNDLSACGANLLSTREYDKEKKLNLTIYLSYPLGNQVQSGKWKVDAQIVRTTPYNYTDKGKLKSQGIAVNFLEFLGIPVTSNTNPWKDAI